MIWLARIGEINATSCREQGA